MILIFIYVSRDRLKQLFNNIFLFSFNQPFLNSPKEESPSISTISNDSSRTKKNPDLRISRCQQKKKKKNQKEISHEYRWLDAIIVEIFNALRTVG